MNSDNTIRNVLVMGVGNSLMQDDGVGGAVIQSLKDSENAHPALRLVDGGTIGLALLPDIEDADAVIVVDAAQLDSPPGEIRVFLGDEIDLRLSEKRSSVHEVALLDLFMAASMRGTLPSKRALVGIQPASTDWGENCTAPVTAAVEQACMTVNRIAATWLNEEAAA